MSEQQTKSELQDAYRVVLSALGELVVIEKATLEDVDNRPEVYEERDTRDLINIVTYVSFSVKARVTPNEIMDEALISANQFLKAKADNYTTFAEYTSKLLSRSS